MHVVFVIKSATKNSMSREIIRRTWASVSYLEGFQFTSVFVMGKGETDRQQALIDEEVERYGDIIQLNISDEYRYTFVHPFEFVILNLCFSLAVAHRNVLKVADSFNPSLRVENSSPWKIFAAAGSHR